jgi:hypothetical protein
MPSFCVAQLNAGDVMFIPTGFLFLEKAVNATSLSIKVAISVALESLFVAFVFV